MLTAIPSRKRPFNVARMRWFFPDAVWWVHEREADTYLEAGVKDQQLWRHTAPKGFAPVVNALLEEVDRRSIDLVTISDDDLREVWCVPSSRVLEPVEIRAMLDNLGQLLVDLDLTIAKVCHDAIAKRWPPNYNRPFRFVEITPQLLVLHGRGIKNWRPDLSMGFGCDVDAALRTLMDERVLICDDRFININPGMYTAPGGNTGTYSPTHRESGNEKMLAKWSGAIKPMTWGTGQGIAPNLSLIRRSNPRAPRL